MSLLPEFNEKFEDLLYDTINIDTEFAKDRWRSPELWTTCASLRALQKLLNPNRNPLTFEEVKAWFDRKVGESECVYHGEYLSRESQKPCYWYEIFWARHYHIFHDGYAKQHLAETLIPFSNLLNELSDNPLYTFCQMKGYVNI